MVESKTREGVKLAFFMSIISVALVGGFLRANQNFQQGTYP